MIVCSLLTCIRFTAFFQRFKVEHNGVRYFLKEHSLLNGPVFIQTLKVEPKTSFENASGKRIHCQ